MRGLPPLPPDVLVFEALGSSGSSSWSIAHSLHCPGSLAYTNSEFQEIVYGWTTFCMPNLLDLMPGNSGFDTCRIRRVGSVPYTYTSDPAVNNGAGGDSQSLNTALCLTWQTEHAGASNRSHTRLPLQAEVVAADKRKIDPVFLAFAVERAGEYVLNLNGIVVASFANPEFVVVSRALGDAPLPAASFSPVVGASVSLRAATLRARLQ